MSIKNEENEILDDENEVTESDAEDIVSADDEENAENRDALVLEKLMAENAKLFTLSFMIYVKGIIVKIKGLILPSVIYPSSSQPV